MARRLEQDSGESRAREIAQFLCELAATEATHSRPEAARAHLEAALEANRKSVRASVQLGDLGGGRGHGEGCDQTAVAFSITTSSLGTSPWKPRVPVLTAAILSTTSVPATTLPNTA